MWGIAMRPCAVRPLAFAGLLLLTACATHRPAPQAAATPVPPAGERDATGAYRFNMTQNGRRMSADEFDAWMKARGIRVAKGAPAKAAPARAVARAKSSSGQAAARATAPAKQATQPVAKTATPPRPAAVAQAKPKAKAPPKPAAKEVSQARAPARQGSGEG